VNTTINNLLSPDILRSSMEHFWSEQLTIEQTGNGLAAALPLMYPDGWQITVNIEPFAPAQAIITDKGRTLMMLDREGLNLDSRAKHNYALLEEKKKIFELDQHGFELRKLIKLPLSGLDIQLFAESLVSISHLIYRNESRSAQEHVVRKSLERTFTACHFTPKQDVYLTGKVGERIHVDFLFEKERQLAMESIEIHDRVKDYMERWAWRWTDLKKQNPELLSAMVYNPDLQDWDTTSLKIGKEVCDLFCPSHDRDQIRDTLIRLKAA
jgi:hypothetical protein